MLGIDYGICNIYDIYDVFGIYNLATRYLWNSYDIYTSL
jgi:hypothetical protein